MNYKYYYWWFKSVLSPKMCEDIIKTGLKQKSQRAITGTEAVKLKNKENLSSKDVQDLKKIRNSKIVFLGEKNLFRIINHYLNIANSSAGWNFQYDFTENPQFTIYKKSDHYTWHRDSFNEPYEKNHHFINYRNKIRKLSMVIQLSDPKKYKGADLEFDFRDNTSGKSEIIKCDEFNKNRGSIIVFPSFIYHRVKPLTKGTRYSLVSWTLGNPYV
jgi:PKHD-type hydroxylase